MTRPLRVTVGVPCYDHFKPQMALSLIGALANDFPFDYHLTAPRGCYLDMGREACIAVALKNESDYLMFIDTDISFPQDGIVRLLRLQKDIVGGAYNEKRLPLVSTVKPFAPDGENFLEGKWTMPIEPFKVAAIATGFMCIDMRRLTATMAPPFFAYSSRRDGDFMGEDIAFCLRARKAGLEIWCDPRIPLQHIGEAAY